MGWMTNLTPLVVSSMGPPVIGCTLFFLTGTSCWDRRSSRPPPSASPLPPTLAFRAAAPMAGRPAAPWAAAVAALLDSAGLASGCRPRRRYHGLPAGCASGRRGRGVALLGRSRVRPPSAPPLPWPARRALSRRGRIAEQPWLPCYAPSPTLHCRHSRRRRV